MNRILVMMGFGVLGIVAIGQGQSQDDSGTVQVNKSITDPNCFGMEAQPIMEVAPPPSEDTDCVKSSAYFYSDWVRFGRPVCWCYRYNCRGDADGKSQGNPVLGLAYVFSNDLNILIRAWNVREPPKGLGIMSILNGICADFDRQQQGHPFIGFARVFSNDLNILIANWNIKEPPKGPGVTECLGYNFFVNP